MSKKLVNSQITNFKTYKMYERQLLTLAENVFEFINLPEFIDVPYLNKNLLIKGSIAFFYDEVMGLLALPFTAIGKLDVYGRPQKIQVISRNGYTRMLDKGEFVIMYDNNGQYPLFLDIIQYAERLGLATRTCDLNIIQQRTPRFWKTKTENVKTIKDLITNVDSNAETIITYDNIDLDDTTLVLNPAPYIADSVEAHKDKIWNEFLRLVGISNLQYQKKERNIKDEISAMQGGTIASRYSRFEPRQKAIKQINEKFGNYLEAPIEVKYYDGLPTTIEEFENNFEDEEDIEDV